MKEWTAREHRKLTRRLRVAKLRYSSASLENVDFKHRRSLDRSQVLALGSCGWIRERHNLIISGPTGIGKSFSGFGFRRTSLPARFQCRLRPNAPALAPTGGRPWRRLLRSCSGTAGQGPICWPSTTGSWPPLRDAERRDLIEVVEERSERSAILIASQLPVADWHGVIGDPNQADAICDRLLHNAHRIELKGRSMRQTKAAPKPSSKEPGMNPTWRRGKSNSDWRPIVADTRSWREGFSGIQ